jgi:hypothetical protein
MHRVQALGTFFTVAGVVGYVVGVLAAYPGRAFSVAGVMVGITLISIGGGLR